MNKTYKEIYCDVIKIIADLWEEISDIRKYTLRAPQDIYDKILNPLYEIMKRDGMESSLQEFVRERDCWRNL